MKAGFWKAGFSFILFCHTTIQKWDWQRRCLKNCYRVKNKRKSTICYALPQGLSLYYLIQSFLHCVVTLHARELECHMMCVKSLNLQVMGLRCEPIPSSKFTIFLSNTRGFVMKIKKEESREVGGREETIIYT